MCQFSCTIPEHLLAGRKIQIKYILRKSSELAKVEWQDHRPFNLYKYNWDKGPWNLPYRCFDKVKRMVRKEKLIQRNWELQFLGKNNDAHVRHWLFENKKLNNLVPEPIVSDIYNRFQVDNVKYSHSISMLITLSLFSQRTDYAPT